MSLPVKEVESCREKAKVVKNKVKMVKNKIEVVKNKVDEKYKMALTGLRTYLAGCSLIICFSCSHVTSILKAKRIGSQYLRAS